MKFVAGFAAVAVLAGGCVSSDTGDGSHDGDAKDATTDSRLTGPYISGEDRRSLCESVSKGAKESSGATGAVAEFDDVEDKRSFCEIEVSFEDSPPLRVRVKFKEYGDDDVKSYDQYRDRTADDADYAKSECGIYITLGAAESGSGNFSAESANIDGDNGQFCALEVYSGTTATFFTRQKTMVSMEFLLTTDVSDDGSETSKGDETSRLEELRKLVAELSLDSFN